MVIISHDAKEAVLAVSYEMSVLEFERRQNWISEELKYLEGHSLDCYTLVFGHSPFLIGLAKGPLSRIKGLDPLTVFHESDSKDANFEMAKFDFSESTLDALYSSEDRNIGSALVNRSLEIMTPEQSRAAMIGLHKRLVSRGRILVVLERSLCVKQHLELLDEDYFEQMISPYFMIESVEETQFETTHHKVYKLRAI